MLDTSVKCAEQASHASRRRRRRQDDEVAKRADRFQSLVQMGELSTARQALEGAAVAPGTEATRFLATFRSEPPLPGKTVDFGTDPPPRSMTIVKNNAGRGASTPGLGG